MGALERIRARGRESLLRQTSPEDSTILAQAETLPDVHLRINHVMDYFLSQLDDGTTKSKRTKLLLKAISDEASEEMVDAPPEAIEFYFKRAAGLIYWAATGEKILNIPWPADLVLPGELAAAESVKEIKATPEVMERVANDKRAVESA